MVSTDDTRLRECLHEIWLSVLKEDDNEDIEESKDEAQPEGDFFSLGGDSLSASEFIEAAQNKGIDIAIEDLFEHPTFAGVVSKAQWSTTDEGHSDGEPGISKGFEILQRREFSKQELDNLNDRVSGGCHVPAIEIEDILPCSPLQTSMMATSLGGRDSYMTQLVFSLDASTDLRRFLRAWEITILANPTLRTRLFSEPEVGCLQCILSTSSGPRVVEADLDTFLSKDAAISMKELDPLFRATVVTRRQSGGTVHHFVITMHRSIIDGFSLPLILEDVSHSYLYNSSTNTRTSIQGLILHLEDMDWEKADKFWQGYIDDASATPFPPSNSSDRQPVAESKLEKAFPIQWTRDRGTTNALLLRAAWTLLMSHRTGNSDVSFACTLDGRSSLIENVRNLCGPTITVVPIRTVVDPSISIGLYLETHRLKAGAMRSFEHYGVSNIRRRLGKDGHHVCNFCNLLIVQPEQAPALANALSALGMCKEQEKELPFQYDFALINETTLTSEGYVANFQYDSAYLSSEQVELLLYQFDAIVRQLNELDLEKPLSDVNFFSSADKDRIASLNARPVEANHALAHDLFQAQCTVFPDKEAIVSWDGRWTFDELDKISRVLANYLITNGTTQNQMIPVYWRSLVGQWLQFFRFSRVDPHGFHLTSIIQSTV